MVNFQELIPGFPEEIALEILSRLHYTAHHAAASVCRKWRHLLKSKQFYFHRKQAGLTHRAACFVQLKAQRPAEGQKSAGLPAFGITVFDSVSQKWERLNSVPGHPNGLPLFCEVASSEGKLVIVGGWEPVSYNPVTDVFVYDFVTRRWHPGKDMPSKRSLFAIGAISGKIFIAGGHDEDKNALNTAWVYDIEKDEWAELTRMSEERDECQGLVIGSEFWVVSGYDTASQGMFKRTAEVYNAELAQWQKVDDVWDTCQNPRLSIGVNKDGKLFNWADIDSMVRVGTCAVELGNRALVRGSNYPGEIRRYFSVERDENGQYGAFKELKVPEEFSGFIQSACHVEI
ncbi:hypothetical protein Ancab_030891 [Ancistrocladus abbreviatus]